MDRRRRGKKSLAEGRLRKEKMGEGERWRDYGREERRGME